MKIMKIIATDDERLALDILIHTIKEIKPNETVYSFNNVNFLLKFAKEHSFDVAF